MLRKIRGQVVILRVIGVGNTLFRDDGIGFYFAEALKKCSTSDLQIESRETLEMTSLELMEGADTVVFIDAGDSKSIGQPKVLSLDAKELEASLDDVTRLMDPHDLSPIQLAALSYKLGLFGGNSYFLLIPAFNLEIGFGISERTFQMALQAASLFERIIENLGGKISLDVECFTSSLRTYMTHHSNP